MSRIPRRGRPPVPRPNDSLNRFKHAFKTKPNRIESKALEVLHSPLRKLRSKEKSLVNRCCYISPVQRDFGQYFTESSTSVSNELRHVTQQTDLDQFVTLIQDGHDPAMPNITYLQTLKNVPYSSSNKVKTSSQRVSKRSGNSAKFEIVTGGSHWQQVGSAEDVDKLIAFSGDIFKNRPSPESSDIKFPSKPMYLYNVPRVKVIAEKFSKYKRGNLELRRLDEKVVCVEYDICSKPVNEAVLNPVQKLRAFFSIKASLDNDDDGSGQKQGIPKLPTNVKTEFGVLDDDLQKITEKEIEFIDGKVEENKAYLDDLRRILKRKHVTNAQKNRTSLDLQSLYEMARKDRRPLNYDFSETNLLSKAELQEVKDLILQQCTSSVQGFSRRTIKKKENGSRMDSSIISEIVMAEFLRGRQT